VDDQLAVKRRENAKHGNPNPTGRINNWKIILNVLLLTYGDRLTIN
jgi:hypothetical protein